MPGDMSRLRVALIGGPMYDDLYEGFMDEVEVVVKADHLTLNEQVAQMLAAGERIDVMSTHGKYVPSQRQWLHPLDDLVDAAVVAALEPGAVALCREQGDLLCVPRNVDVRVLWWRTDRIDRAPDSWVELLESETVFGFTGRGSGLFGLFYEQVVGRGARLFDDDGQPALDPTVATESLEAIATLGARCPSGPDGLSSWHYDEVDAALSAGIVDCSAAWPGATTELRSSPVGDRLRPAPYPSGPVRRVSYSGCHGWAIPRTCGDLDAAVALVERLGSAEFQQVEAAVGGIPAHSDMLAAIRPSDDVDAERLDVTRRTIADAMITYPPLERFPTLENNAAASIRDLLLDRTTAGESLATIKRELDLVARDLGQRGSG
ncbi:MAG TPA: extracellular solute-binding protein [Microthrixaceae bacterium]|nr:extracellular solute-binding protein [Microthrixaceae bacterium]